MGSNLLEITGLAGGFTVGVGFGLAAGVGDGFAVDAGFGLAAGVGDGFAVDAGFGLAVGVGDGFAAIVDEFSSTDADNAKLANKSTLIFLLNIVKLY
jgi:hypothetical protein